MISGSMESTITTSKRNPERVCQGGQQRRDGRGDTVTREEAINILDDFDVNFEGHTAEEVSEAFDMAFKALSQEPTVTTNNNEPMTVIYPTIVCDDAISRDAAIEAVSEGCQEWRGIYGRCEELINALPSVTQKSKKGCEDCIYEKTGNNSTYPCSHCSRCYTDKYRAESEVRNDKRTER